MILATIICAQQIVRKVPEPPPGHIDFSTQDLRDIYRFIWYVKLRKNVEAYTFTSSGGGALFCKCTAEERKQLVLDFESEFGVNISKVDKEYRFVIPFSLCRPDLSGNPSVKQFEDGLSKGSILRSAIQETVRAGEIRREEHVSSLEYRIRPVLLKTLKRGELVEGTINVDRSGKKVEAKLHYER